MARTTTYRNLFDLLASLGFAERRFETPAGSRSFTHAETDVVLLFRRPPAEHLTSADALSTEVHLQGRGIIAGPLETLLAAM